MEINELRKKLREYADAYYNNDQPIVTDEEYDALMRQLRQMEKEHPELVTVDSPTQVVGGKRVIGIPVEHKVPMLSLLDVFSDKEVKEFLHDVYTVSLRKDTKDVIATELIKTNSDEEKEAFYDAMDSYYALHYELLCELYNIVPYAWDYGGGGSGSYQPGMTPEEIEDLLEQLQIDPDSARGSLVQVALSSIGKFTYNQVNGFRTGVNSGLYSPGNVNYTGTELDCSSFVQYCYFMAGIPFSPTNTSSYASAIANGELVRISANDVRPGDLQVVYPTSSYEGHVWMYVGNNTWCECTPNGGVRADNWSKNFMSSHPSVYVRSVFLP